MVHFLIPDPTAFPSGGNIYNAQLIKALEEIGCALTISHRLEEFKVKKESQILLVDTLFLQDFDPEEYKGLCILIVHHLASMESLFAAQLTEERKLLFPYDGFLSTSNFTRNYLREKMELDQAIITIPPAFDWIEKASNPVTDSLTVLMVANLIPRKGVLPFLQVWTRYSWSANFQLLIIGDPNMDKQYAKSCQRFKEGLSPAQRDQIIFTGALEQKVIFQKYQEAAALVSAASVETFGMALQEAANFSLPLLVLDGGYAGVHVEEDNGAVFQSVEELVLGLKKWTENPALRKDYALAAQDLATRTTRTWKEAAGYFLQHLKHKFPMPENAFDTTWLNTRFPFDEAARNPEVDLAAHEFLQSVGAASKTISLLDIGAGTGANFLHFYEQLPFAQKWTFLDHDQRLLNASLRRIEKEAVAKNYPTQRKAASLLIHHPNGNIEVNTICGSFEQLSTLVNLPEIDLVMASAFFDLFTPQQLTTFLDEIRKASTALLLSLNYSEMTFAPANEWDEQVVQWYEDHMQRPQAGGQAMGPECSKGIHEYLKNSEVNFTVGESVWNIQGEDQAMLTFLLGFMEEAIGALDLATKDQELIAEWLTERRSQMAQKKLSLQVQHSDFFTKDF